MRLLCGGPAALHEPFLNPVGNAIFQALSASLARGLLPIIVVFAASHLPVCRELGGNLLSGPLPPDIVCNLPSLAYLKACTHVHVYACAVAQQLCLLGVIGSSAAGNSSERLRSVPCHFAAGQQPVHWRPAGQLGCMPGGCCLLPVMCDLIGTENVLEREPECSQCFLGTFKAGSTGKSYCHKADHAR